MNFWLRLALFGAVLLSAISCVATRGKPESAPVGTLTGPYRSIAFVPSISESGGVMEFSTLKRGDEAIEQSYFERQVRDMTQPEKCSLSWP